MLDSIKPPLDSTKLRRSSPTSIISAPHFGKADSMLKIIGFAAMLASVCASIRFDHWRFGRLERRLGKFDMRFDSRIDGFDAGFDSVITRLDAIQTEMTYQLSRREQRES